ncbi:MAG: YkgJ family cysteine cluster protein [Planctomycetaceae bacterium]
MSEPTSICHSCHAGCCRAFAIPVTGADVLRLAQGTQSNFWDFACRWADPEGIIAGDYVPHLRFEDEPETPFVLCLSQQSSQLFPGTSRCRFLEETVPDAAHPLGTGRCGAYQHRPAACRVFPLRMRASSLLTVLGEVAEHGRPADGGAAYQLCPRPWETSDIDPVAGPQDVAVAKFEAEFFRQVVAVWNRRPGRWETFPDFLQLVYEQRVVKQPADDQRDEVATMSFSAAPLQHRHRFAA